MFNEELTTVAAAMVHRLHNNIFMATAMSRTTVDYNSRIVDGNGSSWTDGNRLLDDG